VVGDWSVRDVLQHLSIWEAETIQLIRHFRQGRVPTSERFRRDTDELNAKWHAASRDRPLERVVADFHAVRVQTGRQIDGLTDEDVRRAPTFPWMKGKALGEWIAGDTYLHEQEHTAQILAWRSTLLPQSLPGAGPGDREPT
jgi:hypothetical protein